MLIGIPEFWIRLPEFKKSSYPGNLLSDISTANAFLILNNDIYRITRNITSIGRSLGNHIVIRDANVSRKHAEIRFQKNKFVLVDLESTGGTFINSNKISKSGIKSGDSILLASVPMVFAQNQPQMAGRDAPNLLGPDNDPTDMQKALDWRL